MGQFEVVNEKVFKQMTDNLEVVSKNFIEEAIEKDLAEGKKVKIIDSRNHIGGNVYTENIN